LDKDSFVEVLPLLRRTFANYTNTERRKLGEKVRAGDEGVSVSAGVEEQSFDFERARLGIPVVLRLFGLSNKQTSDNE
jgi:hypothetical protein